MITFGEVSAFVGLIFLLAGVLCCAVPRPSKVRPTVKPLTDAERNAVRHELEEFYLK